MQLRPPERLLGGLLHVHVVPRDREGPVYPVPEEGIDHEPEPGREIPAYDPGARECKARGEDGAGVSRPGPEVRRVPKVAERGGGLTVHKALIISVSIHRQYSFENNVDRGI